MMTSMCLAILLVPACIAPLVSQEPEQLQANLEKSVQGYAICEPDFAKALIAVASQFEIAMGIEWVRPARPQKVNLSWHKATVRQIIESIIKIEPGYDLRVEDGVVHIFSKDLIKDRSNFLNIKIEKFGMRNEYAALGVRKLWGIVRRRVSPSAPPPAPGESEISSIILRPGDNRLSLTLENVTARNILDRIALASACKIWIVTFSAEPSLTAAGFRRTASPRDGKPTANSEEPAWDCLRWGQKPYW